MFRLTVAIASVLFLFTACGGPGEVSAGELPSDYGRPCFDADACRDVLVEGVACRVLMNGVGACWSSSPHCPEGTVAPAGGGACAQSCVLASDCRSGTACVDVGQQPLAARYPTKVCLPSATVSPAQDPVAWPQPSDVNQR